MDNQTMGQNQNMTWWALGAIVVIALGLWYFYGTKSSTVGVQGTNTPAEQSLGLTSGNTTVDISNDLNATPNDISALNADAAASASAVQGL